MRSRSNFSRFSSSQILQLLEVDQLFDHHFSERQKYGYLGYRCIRVKKQQDSLGIDTFLIAHYFRTAFFQLNCRRAAKLIKGDCLKSYGNVLDFIEMIND